MGLDTVKLVLDIEEAFDVAIPADRASHMFTVGDVYDFLLEKSPDSKISSSRCISAATFYELRNHAHAIGLTTSPFRPKSPINTALPILTRHHHWNAIASRMDVQFPRLSRPSWLSLLICIATASITFSTFCLVARSNIMIATAGSVAIGTITAAILVLLTKSLALYPPTTCVTIGDLVTNIVAINYSKLASRYSARNPNDLWNALQLIVAEQFGVDRSIVIPTARFVEDLGAD